MFITITNANQCSFCVTYHFQVFPIWPVLNYPLKVDQLRGSLLKTTFALLKDESWLICQFAVVPLLLLSRGKCLSTNSIIVYNASKIHSMPGTEYILVNNHDVRAWSSGLIAQLPCLVRWTNKNYCYNLLSTAIFISAPVRVYALHCTLNELRHSVTISWKDDTWTADQNDLVCTKRAIQANINNDNNALAS